VLTFHGTDINKRSYRLISRIVSRRARTRIFVSPELASKVPARSNDVVIPCGVDTFHFSPGDRADARAVLGLDPDAPLILFGAPPDRPGKGWHRFCRVLEYVQASYPDARGLLLATPPVDRGQVPDKYRASNCLLFVSDQGTEGSPMVIKEALATGLPIVSTDVGDVRARIEGIGLCVVTRWEADDDAVIRGLARGVMRALSTEWRGSFYPDRSDFDGSIVARRLLTLYGEALQ